MNPKVVKKRYREEFWDRSYGNLYIFFGFFGFSEIKYENHYLFQCFYFT